ncbi:isochorismate synthase DhbC [Lentibacillus sp. N15]|uniref:isochorismate synthase DhbC n=1 Tax=Lentibacillus songyuanensis TaxID=3136161 RepID=UPI0031BB8854
MSGRTRVSTQKSILDIYEAGDFFLASPQRTIIGKGVFTVVEKEKEIENQLIRLPSRVESALHHAKKSGDPYPIAMGAVPFDDTGFAEIIIPEEVDVSGPMYMEDEKRNALLTVDSYDMQAVPNPELYMKGVNQGLEKIAAEHLDKIVISRALHFTTKEKVDVKQLLKNLAQHNPQGYTFAVDLSEKGWANQQKAKEKRTLIGSSPELLVSKCDHRLFANPLAGSRPRSADPVEDQRRALELLNSEKDLYEHAVVVDMVKEALTPFCETLDVPESPSLIKTEAMWHLSSEIQGRVKKVETSSLELAVALHPTPAICGYPTAVARDAIHEIEPFNREFFTGMVGWCDINGNGEWIITIRCAEVKERSLRLYAGAGVVAGSKAEEELNETSAKFQTMLQAMGIED